MLKRLFNKYAQIFIKVVFEFANEEEIIILTLKDLQGKVIKREIYNRAQKCIFDIGNMAKGSYYLKVKTSSNEENILLSN
jgi:5S rRNA maturation endonuclease (ribonuclease M5)